MGAWAHPAKVQLFSAKTAVLGRYPAKVQLFSSE
jgi:hypothetical protein